MTLLTLIICVETFWSLKRVFLLLEAFMTAVNCIESKNWADGAISPVCILNGLLRVKKRYGRLIWLRMLTIVDSPKVTVEVGQGRRLRWVIFGSGHNVAGVVISGSSGILLLYVIYL